MAFSKNLINKLADKVTEEKGKLRNALLKRKAFAKGVLPEDITLTRDVKDLYTREAFKKVLSAYPKEFKELKRVVGKELSRRKQERKAYRNAVFLIILSELSDKENLAQDLESKNNCSFYQHMATTCAKELSERNLKHAIQIGRIRIDEFGDAIIFKDEL